MWCRDFRRPRRTETKGRSNEWGLEDEDEEVRVGGRSENKIKGKPTLFYRALGMKRNREDGRTNLHSRVAVVVQP